jgi:hypothetical protein
MVNATRRCIFGFSVDSDIPFRFLRHGEAKLRLRVDEESDSALQLDGEPLFEWKLRDQTSVITARLFHSDGMYHFWAGDAGWYRIDPVNGVITIPSEADEVRRELRLWGIPTMLCFVELGDVPLHASAVEIAGGAVLFAAPGRFGKTTLALAFHTRGYRVLSEDLSCCRLSPELAILPGPASLRVRPDMFDGRVPHGTGLVSVKPDRVVLALDSDRTGDCKPLPIKSIVFLRESRDDDQIRLERVEGVRSLPDLWALSFRPKGDTGLARSFRGLSSLATATTVWNLYRPLRTDTLNDVVDHIVNVCGPGA